MTDKPEPEITHHGAALRDWRRLSDDELTEIINSRLPLSLIMGRDGLFLVHDCRSYTLTPMQTDVVLRYVAPQSPEKTPEPRRPPA